MGQPVTLIPLVCIKCSTPVPAKPNEQVWVCQQCGQALILNEDEAAAAAPALSPLTIQYSSNLRPGQPGKPFWVVDATVQVQRAVMGMTNEDAAANHYWMLPKRFFLPAFDVELASLLNISMRLLGRPPALHPGGSGPFDPVTLSRLDLQSAVEYLVTTAEADRKDSLKSLSVTAALSEPALWILSQADFMGG